MSIAAAGATLERAARFWAARCDRLDAVWHEPHVAVRARYLANGFRELDRFLRVLLDTVSPTPYHRNTASKLGALMVNGRTVTAVSAADCDRLHAIKRSASCLFHLGGVVKRPDLAGGSWMTAGWTDADGAALRRYTLGALLRPQAAEITDVCAFYLRVAEAVRR